jgi:ribosome assembly protein 4
MASTQVTPSTRNPQAVFRVRPVTQCSATIPGHADNIVELYFSPDGRRLASGSGDCTVRFWDVWTQTPEKTCKGHTHWVQCIAWAPDGRTLASGSVDGTVRQVSRVLGAFCFFA